MMQNEQAENIVKEKPILRPFYVWAILAVVLAVVVVGLNLPAIGSCRCYNPDPKAIAASRVRSLAQGLTMYAIDHGDEFPLHDQWVDDLVGFGVLDFDDFVSPAEDEDGVSYIFVPGPFSFDATQILIYEDPKHWEDFVIVGFADASTEFVEHEDFEQMLAEQLAAQSSP